MKIEYFPKTDTLSILLSVDAEYMEGEDTNDADITLLYDSENRLAEIVVEHASNRVDLEGVKRQIGFREVTSAEAGRRS